MATIQQALKLLVSVPVSSLTQMKPVEVTAVPRQWNSYQPSTYPKKLHTMLSKVDTILLSSRQKLRLFRDTVCPTSLGTFPLPISHLMG